MKLKMIAITALSLLALSVQSVMASAVGYNHLIVPANSDALLTVAFTHPAAGTFTVTGVTGSGVTVAGPLTVDQFSGSKFFVRFNDGNGKGLWSTITSNTTTDIVLQNTTILSSIANGNTFTIYPHETLGTVFPSGMEGLSFIKTTALGNHQTEVLMPNTTSVGINKPASAIYFYFNGAWRKQGQSPATSFNDTVLNPQEYFTLRNRSNTTLEYISLGESAAVPVARLLAIAATKNDISAGAGFPTQLTLAQLHLGGTPAFVTTTALGNHQDELLVFNNSAVGLNKPASAIYFYFNGNWRKQGQSPTVSFDNQVLDASSALLIRKAAGSPGVVTWAQPEAF